MSGLENVPYEGGKNFVNIKDGLLISGPKNAKQTYTHLTGTITELDIKDETYEGKEYRKITLTIEAGDEEYFLGFPLESGYGKAFACISPNIDFSKEVSISAGSDLIPNTKKKYGKMFVKQDGVNLKWYFKKDSGLPAGEKKKDRNGEFMDYAEQNDFLWKLLMMKIRPAILKGVIPSEQKKAAKKKGEPAEAIDDLPF